MTLNKSLSSITTVKICLLLLSTLNISLYSQVDEKQFKSARPPCKFYGCWIYELSYNSEYMGPNSLPVPEAISECVDNECQVETRLNAQNAPGDDTKSVYARFTIPIVSNVIAFEANAIVYEEYELDFARRLKYRAWYGKGKGSTRGDINLSSIFQIVRNKTFPDVVFRFNLRSTTGYNILDARYTDAPGLFCDLSLGKNFHFGNAIFKGLRPYISGGFYSYQTNRYYHRQNDAILFNSGINFYIYKLKANVEMAGYCGYENEGDRPLLFRANLNYLTKWFIYQVGTQKGINDYDYTTIYAGFTWKFDVSGFFERLRSKK